MKQKLTAVLLALSLSACTTNGVYDPVKTWTLVGVVVVGGAMAASDSGSKEGKSGGSGCYIVIPVSGPSYQVCR